MEDGNNSISKCIICGEIPPGREPDRPHDALVLVGNKTYEEWVTYWNPIDKVYANISSDEWFRRKEIGNKWSKTYSEWKRVDDKHRVCLDRFERLRYSKIPIRYKLTESLSSNPGNQQALAVIEEYKKSNRKDGLILYGQVGVGKTHLMAQFARYLILYKGASLTWWNTANLFTTLKNNIGKKYQENEDDDNEEIINSAIETSWLFLDDLGREKVSDWTHEVLFHIVNSRYEQNRNSIVISSNYAPMQLAERIGDQIVSRLIEMCSEPINITGSDWRFKKYTKTL